MFQPWMFQPKGWSRYDVSTMDVSAQGLVQVGCFSPRVGPGRMFQPKGWSWYVTAMDVSAQGLARYDVSAQGLVQV